MTYLSAFGDLTDVGISPYKISGDPVTALVAQVNRFAGKTVRAGGTCGARTLVPKAFPLGPVITEASATAAALIVWTRYTCVPVELRSPTKEKWISDGLFNPKPSTWSFAMNNLHELTITIAQFGDSLGFAPATVGITQVDPKMAPKFPIRTVALLGVLALGAFMVSRRKR